MDRATALIGGALLDTALKLLICTQFRELTNEQADDIFDGPTASLSSFSAKIRIAHALGFYGSKTLQDLERVKTIRNTFAHTLVPITFETEEVNAVCNNLTVAFQLVGHDRIQKYIDDPYTPKNRFIISVSFVLGSFNIFYNNDSDAPNHLKPFSEVLP